MRADSKLKFGVIGAGAIAQVYAQAFGESESAQVSGVADLRNEAAEAIALTLGCPSFASHETLAKSTAIDAVVVCTPPDTHPEICRYFLERGVHVLCEKPLATDSTRARQMLEVAEKAGCQLTMASKFRYVEDVIRAKSIVASGILGEIVLFENAFTGRVDMSNRWNSDPARSGGGVLIDNGTHSVDIMRYFLGPLRELQTLEGERVQQLAVEDTVRLFVRSAGGVMGSIDLSWSIHKELPNYISIYGSSGAIHVGWRESKYRRSSDDEWIVFGAGYDKIQAFSRQIDNFAASVRGEETPRITSEDAMASVEVIETAYKSLRDSRWRPIQDSASLKRNGEKLVEPVEEAS